MARIVHTNRRNVNFLFVAMAAKDYDGQSVLSECQEKVFNHDMARNMNTLLSFDWTKDNVAIYPLMTTLRVRRTTNGSSLTIPNQMCITPLKKAASASLFRRLRKKGLMSNDESTKRNLESRKFVLRGNPDEMAMRRLFIDLNEIEYGQTTDTVSRFTTESTFTNVARFVRTNAHKLGPAFEGIYQEDDLTTYEKITNDEYAAATGGGGRMVL
jgi:hypothetical protein